MVYILIFMLAVVQNISYTLVSRARNRDHVGNHIICSLLSNSLWFATMHVLVTTDLSLAMALPYVLGTALGSVFGAKISLVVEDKLKVTVKL